MKSIKVFLVFIVSFALGLGVFILAGKLDLFLHPYIAGTEWTWFHLLSRHCLGIAWFNGVLWPHLILSVLAGALGVWVYSDKN